MSPAGAAVLALLAGLSVAVSPAADAADPAPSKDLKQLEREIRESTKKKEALAERTRELENQVEALRDELVAAAQIVQDQERRVIQVRRRLAALNRVRDAKAGQLKEDRRRFARLLVALQRIAQFPPEALIAQPITPADAVRSAILLRATVGEVERRARGLADEVELLAAARDEAAAEEAELASLLVNLDRQRRRLEALMARKEVLKRRAETKALREGHRLRRLAEKARNLRDLMARLESDRKRREEEETARSGSAAAPTGPPRPISAAKGRMPLPVSGAVASRYGEKTEAGLTRKGITIATEPGAAVVATHDGKVAFAGQFRGYGLLLIIEHGEGYHSLLAGMARIDVDPGNAVAAGEPVGVMGRGAGDQPVLYVEFRRDGQPINPLPWLASRKDEVNG